MNSDATSRLRAAWAMVRREERALFGLWAVGVLLCLMSDASGFQFFDVFMGYVGFFTRYIVYLFVFTRVVFLLDERWKPTRPWLRRARLWLLGPDEPMTPRGIDRWVIRNGDELGAAPRPSVLRMDAEFLRMALLLFANLAVYSNIKLRIPFINPLVGDEAFEQMDHALFGERLIAWTERWFADNPGVAEYFANVYMHDYVWMIVLVLLLYIRRDWFALRWTVISVCFVYIFGILLTVAYPSYGPCFLDADRFEWLQQTRVGRAQSFLATMYNQSHRIIAAGGNFESRPFAGIAAFPSLHVAHMVVMLVVALRTVPIYALWMVWVTTATFIATIGFGWHYAVDGVAGVLLAVLFTSGLYHLLRRWDERSC